MIYKLFLYNTSAMDVDAPAITIINNTLSAFAFDASTYYSGNACTHMEPFDAESVKAQIQQELADLCKVEVAHMPGKEGTMPYLHISTSYEKVREVLPKIHAIAATNRLVLFDKTRDRAFFKDLFEDDHINLKLRGLELTKKIRATIPRIWHFKQVFSDYTGLVKEDAYVITLTKDLEVPFTQRVSDFKDCLLGALKPGEKLSCTDQMFIVWAKGYSITFIIEGYKKHAEWFGHCDDGKAGIKPLHRMPFWQAYKWMEKNANANEKDDIWARMNILEMTEAYPDPSDRFVESVNIAKRHRRSPFYLRIGSGRGNSDFIFHVVPADEVWDSSKYSVLGMGEDSATFILPFIREFYPYLGDRYYLCDNHLPSQMWRDITERIMKVRDRFIHDPYNPEFASYIPQFNLHILSKTPADEQLIAENPAQFCCDHRREIADLWMEFATWSKTQLKVWWDSDNMYNIVGP